MQKKYRLRGQKVFNYVLKKGSTARSKAFILIYTPSKYPLHVGFIVSKKVGNAVIRNRTRRRLRESFRSLIPNIADNYNYVIIAKPGIDILDSATIKETLTETLKKAGLHKEN